VLTTSLREIDEATPSKTLDVVEDYRAARFALR
jgi:hypothetical protein